MVKPAAPWLVNIEGHRRIGKTTPADALLRHLIQEGLVDNIAWISARQQRLDPAGRLHLEAKPALTAEELIDRLIEQLFPYGLRKNSPEERYNALYDRLHSVQYIVVVDNLETVTDVEELLPVLQALANPSKFIFTSRTTLFGIPNLYHFKMAELSEASAITLIRQEAEISGLPVLATASDALLRPVYETVGGSPLALRLVVGQVHLYPLDAILADLRAVKSHSADTLYTYIYRKAWEVLNETSRRALLAMPLADPIGEEITFIAEVGDLEIEELRQALNQLVTLSLVNAVGGLCERRYSIHGLTRTFLEYHVAKWLAEPRTSEKSS
ncbi:MAG: hypothetical protein R2932_28460 [Caldilineaceae bacterium]